MTDQTTVAAIAPESTPDKLSIDRAMSSGWEHMKKSFFPYLGIMAVNGLFAMVPGVIAFFLGTSVSMSLESIMLSIALACAGLLLTMLIELGMINVQLRILDGKPVKSDDVFRCYPMLLKFAGAAILYRFAMALGYICFIIPGIIVQISFQFYGYFIVDKKMGPIEALKASWELVNGVRLTVFLFGIIQYFVHWLGAMCFLVGSIPATMVCSLALASAYRQMLSSTPPLAAIGAGDEPI